MAAYHATDCQPPPTHTPVTTNRFNAVLGTRGIETAPGPEHWADYQLVAAQETCQEPTHFLVNFAQRRSSILVNVAVSRSRVPGFERTTISTAGSWANRSRNVWRTARFIRLRSTARGTDRLEIARPSRAWPNVLGRASTVKCWSATRVASAKTCRKTAGVSSLTLRGNALPLPVGRSGKLRRQSCAALGTPCLDDAAAVLGGHTGTEAVGTLALDDAGLESPLHESIQYLNAGGGPGITPIESARECTSKQGACQFRVTGSETAACG